MKGTHRTPQLQSLSATNINSSALLVAGVIHFKSRMRGKTSEIAAYCVR